MDPVEEAGGMTLDEALHAKEQSMEAPVSASGALEEDEQPVEPVRTLPLPHPVLLSRL